MKTVFPLFSAAALAFAAAAPLFAQIVLPPLPAPAAAEEGEEPEKPLKPRGEVDQLLDMSSFERPRVKGRTPWDKGGNPAPRSLGEWKSFQPNSAVRNEGVMQAGLTDEIARSGKQALFVAFNKTKSVLGRYDLTSSLIRVRPNFTYRVSIWGRMDKPNPITIDQRIPAMRLQVDFFQADRQTQAGESVIKAQTLPGVLNRGFVFTPDRWTEFMADVESPEDAAFIRITWTWNTPTDEGTTDGTIYFDDLGLYGERPDPVPDDEAPASPEELGETPPAAEAPEAPAPAAPAAPEQ
jgi:hypothetical protein